jgi:hypothetical protein
VATKIHFNYLTTVHNGEVLWVQVNFIFNDNVRILRLSCNINQLFCTRRKTLWSFSFTLVFTYVLPSRIWFPFNNLSWVQVNFIFNDNVRILRLSCNIKKFKTTAKLSEKNWNNRRSNRFQWCYIVKYKINLHSQIFSIMHSCQIIKMYFVATFDDLQLITLWYSPFTPMGKFIWKPSLPLCYFTDIICVF